MLCTALVTRIPGAVFLVPAEILVHGAAASGSDGRIPWPTEVITGTFGIHFFTRLGADPKE